MAAVTEVESGGRDVLDHDVARATRVAGAIRYNRHDAVLEWFRRLQ